MLSIPQALEWPSNKSKLLKLYVKHTQLDTKTKFKNFLNHFGRYYRTVESPTRYSDTHWQQVHYHETTKLLHQNKSKQEQFNKIIMYLIIYKRNIYVQIQHILQIQISKNVTTIVILNEMIQRHLLTCKN